MRFMVRGLTTTTVLLASLALTLGSAQAVSPEAESSPTVAAANSPKLKLKAKNASVTKVENCTFSKVTISHNLKNAVRIQADYEIRRGGKRIESDSVIDDQYNSTVQSPLEFNWCWTNLFQGKLGKHEVRLKKFTWWDGDEKKHSVKPGLNAKFTVKQGVKISKPKAKKKGKTRTLTTQVKYLRIIDYDNRWRPIKKKKVTLEVRDAKGKKAWKKLKTVKTDSKGKVSVKVKAKKTQQYRFVYKGNSKIAKKTSKTVKK